MATGSIKKQPIIQAGSVAFSTATTGTKEVPVTFAKPFAKTPTVICVWREQNIYEWFNGNVEPNNISATGFTAKANAKRQGNYSWYAQYIAIEL